MVDMRKALRRAGRGAAIAALAAGMMACSSDEEAADATPEAPAAPEKAFMQSVSAIDFGRTFENVVISVEGYAPGLGYQSPELRNHDGGPRSADGFAQFDFVAAPPDEELAKTLPAPGSNNALRMRADRELPLAVLQGLRGVRVFTAHGAATRLF